MEDARSEGSSPEALRSVEAASSSPRPSKVPTSLEYSRLSFAADRAAVEAQKTYFWFVRTLLIFPLFIIPLGSKQDIWAGAVIAAFFAAGMVVSTVLLFLRPERKWFGARALSESLKTMAWRYAMRVPPYDCDPEPGTEGPRADDRFHREVRQLLAMRPDLGGSLITMRGIGSGITASMQAIREVPTLSRRDIYLDQRLREQREWYATKSDYNEIRSRQWLKALLLFQGAGLTSAILLIIFWKERGSTDHLTTLFSALTGLFSGLLASAIAWLQVKRHQDLAQSYGMTALNLAAIEGGTEHIRTEPALQEWVSESEDAISREHTLWQARRGCPASVEM